MELPNLQITAFLNPNEGGCDYSSHFRTHWINNSKLHPFAKQIPVATLQASATPPRVTLTANGNKVWDKTGNQIDPANLQEFILETYVR